MKYKSFKPASVIILKASYTYFLFLDFCHGLGKLGLVREILIPKFASTTRIFASTTRSKAASREQKWVGRGQSSRITRGNTSRTAWMRECRSELISRRTSKWWEGTNSRLSAFHPRTDSRNSGRSIVTWAPAYARGGRGKLVRGGEGSYRGLHPKKPRQVLGRDWSVAVERDGEVNHRIRSLQAAQEDGPFPEGAGQDLPQELGEGSGDVLDRASTDGVETRTVCVYRRDDNEDGGYVQEKGARRHVSPLAHPPTHNRCCSPALIC